MKKKYISEGIQLGFITGVTTVLFDLMFSLKPGMYVLSSYLFLLLIFNLLFWVCFGGISGLVIERVLPKKNGVYKNEGAYWVVFFLLPFALIYGYLGRANFPPPFAIYFKIPIFDYHFSFVWVFLLIGFQLLTFKRYPKRKHISLLFALEILFFILIFQFGTNINHYESLKNIIGLFNKDTKIYYILLYLIVILTMITVYFCAHCARLRIKSSTKFTYKLISIYTVILIAFIAFSLLQANKHFANSLVFENAEHNNKTDRITPVFLIVMDTVRADRLSIYGGHPKTTPNLMNLSRDALVFENCIASSFLSIFA